MIMSMLMMNKKKSPALVIVAGMRKEREEEPYENKEKSEKMDHIKLAAYELADKAGWHIVDMDEFLSAFKMLHMYLHEEEEESQYNPTEY